MPGSFSRGLSAAVVVFLLGTGLVVADNGPAHQVKQGFPILLGTSGGNVNNRSSAFCCSGTLGSLVTKTGSRTTQYILSNNHVLADTGTATFGDNISQPGLVDVGCDVTQTNTVANFSQAVPLGTANVDAAIAQVVAGAVNSGGGILDVGVPASSPATASVNMGVAKSGRTTGLTCASIASVSTNVSVQYQKGCGTGKKFILNYKNQVVINSTSFSAGGDSGSLIVNSSTAQPVALLFAGSSSSTIGNPIQDVIKSLSISFVGGTTTHSITCPSGGGQASTQGLSASEVDRATAAKDRHADRLMADPAVQGVGVGAAADNPEEAVVVIYLETGRAHGPLPDELDGVRTQIIRTDRFRAFGWNEPEVPQACSANR